jgi:hypothetical protein
MFASVSLRVACIVCVYVDLHVRAPSQLGCVLYVLDAARLAARRTLLFAGRFVAIARVVFLP